MKNDMKIPIIEIFKGVQGEQTTQGLPQVFVRVATCNLRCAICDSKYTWMDKNTALKKYAKPIEQIIKEIKKYKIKSVCITGGEATNFEREVTALVKQLKKEHYHIVLQTNGTKYCKTLFRLVDQVAMDMKTPCTGEKSDERLIKYLRAGKDCVKTLILGEEDLKYAAHINRITRRYGITQILQPCNEVGKDNVHSLLKKLRWIVERVLQEPEKWVDVRILPQQHVLIYGNRRGV